MQLITFLIANTVNEMFKFFDLTHFWSMVPFYIPLQHQKMFGFLVFSGGSKWEGWSERVNHFESIFLYIENNTHINIVNINNLLLCAYEFIFVRLWKILSLSALFT